MPQPHDLNPRKPLDSILIKPAGADCNLDCRYCFYLDRAGVARPGFDPDRPADRIQGRRMSAEVLEEMIRQMMATGNSPVSFGWQGGEPTLMGLDFYRRAIELQKQYGQSGQVVGNALQTNGILVDRAWCDFLAKTQWLVGLSIDGPDHVHDHYRRTQNGRPTYPQVARAAELMTESAVAFNALSVVTDYSARFGPEIYHHHKSLGMTYMQFIPCLERIGDDPNNIAPFSVSPEAYGDFLCSVFDCWKKDFQSGQPTTVVRYFDSVLHTYLNRTPPECTLMKECGTYLAVEHNGDVYSCDFFVTPTWHLGNLLETHLQDLLNSPLQNRFGQAKLDLPQRCRECPWLKHCLGGCPKDRQRDESTMNLDFFCRAKQRFFEHAHRDLTSMAESFRRREQFLKQSRQYQRGPAGRKA